MAKKNEKKGLGRGLGSLMGETLKETSTDPVRPANPDKVEVQPVVEEPTPEVTTRKASSATSSAKPTRRTVASSAKKETEPKPEPKAKEKAPEAAEEARKPYIEEDDHVVIGKVVSREKAKPDEVSINDVVPNPDQPRTTFKKEEISELAASIEKEGLLQPVLVRQVGKKYQIIAGERRWQACKSLGMKTIPVRFKEATDDKALELALIENIQRSDLNPIEEAYGYKRLMERKGMTQSEVAIAVSKGRSTVANALRLLELPEDAQQLLFEEKITAGHARAILSIPTKEGRTRLTNKLRDEKLTVREAEQLARLFAGKDKSTSSDSARTPTPLYFKTAARTLRDALGTNVRLKNAKGKNKIEIEFKDEADLERMFAILTGDQS